MPKTSPAAVATPRPATSQPTALSAKLAYDTIELAELLGELSRKERAYELCGRGFLRGESPDGTRVLFLPITCKSWRCKKCAPRKRYLWRKRIIAGHPDRFITLTVDSTWYSQRGQAVDAMKRAWPLFVRAVRETYGDFQYIAAWQLTKKGYPHIHICARGSYIPQRWLSDVWGRLVKSRVVDIRAIKNVAQLSAYVSRYMLRDAAPTAQAFPGRRIITCSRQYAPDVDPAGAESPYRLWSWHWHDAPLFDWVKANIKQLHRPILMAWFGQSLLFELPLGISVLRSPDPFDPAFT